MTTHLLAPPGDVLRLTSDFDRVFDLARRLWEEISASDPLGAAPIELTVASEETEEARPSPRPGDFLEGASAVAPPAPAAPRGDADPSYSFEEDLRWTHEAHEFRCEVPGALDVRIDLQGARVEARLAARIADFLSSSPSKKSSSSLLFSFLARTLLEAPGAVLLGRRGWQVLHAGAVVGPRGAAVLRGPSGAGKSTLVAAAHAAGLGVLGDESVFVSRTDPDDLAASVRDLALREDSARLLGIFDATEPAFTGREGKRRVDLFNGSSPAHRRARRAAAVLLGPREPRPARLTPLRGAAFRDAFRAGGIPQEQPGDPGAVARAWEADGWLLSGASDLDGAVDLLKRLVT